MKNSESLRNGIGIEDQREFGGVTKREDLVQE